MSESKVMSGGSVAIQPFPLLSREQKALCRKFQKGVKKKANAGDKAMSAKQTHSVLFNQLCERKHIMKLKLISQAILSTLALVVIAAPLISGATNPGDPPKKKEGGKGESYTWKVQAPPAQGTSNPAPQMLAGAARLEPMPDHEFSEAEDEGRKMAVPGASKMPCPNPVTIFLSAPPPNPSTPNLSDFHNFNPPPVYTTMWNDPNINRVFRHTFNWNLPQGQCCQFIKGGLQVSYRANTSGQSQSSSDAGNDTVSIWKGGQGLAWQFLYGPPIAAGTTGSKSFALTANMVQGKQLSFAVQDDTAVTGAKMFVRYCCVTPTK